MGGSYLIPLRLGDLVQLAREGDPGVVDKNVDWPTAEMMKQIGGASAHFKARIAGVFYLLAILTGVFAVYIVGGRLGFVAELIAGLFYIAATLLLYHIFKPVNRILSLLAAFFGLAVSIVGAYEWHPQGLDIGLISLGLHCLLIGYLIFRSTFLPRILSALMALAGLAWLTFQSPPLQDYLSTYNLAAGILGQGSLTLWLLVKGVNAQRWKEQASAAGAFIST